MTTEKKMVLNDYVKKASVLFALPETALRMQELLNDDTSSLADVADVVSIDPNLTSMLLKIANSAFYNFPSTIDTVSRAINIIGTEGVFNLALASSAVNCFKGIPENVIDLELFWRHSVDTALICKELAARLNNKNQERLFVIGLLHNLGELICANQNPEMAKECAIPNKNTAPWEWQQAKLGFTYAELSEGLLKDWQLPANIHNVVGNQHNPEKSAFPIEANILCLASHIASDLASKNGYDATNHDIVDFTDRLGITADNIQQAVEFASLEAITILSILNPVAGTIF